MWRFVIVNGLQLFNVKAYHIFGREMILFFFLPIVFDKLNIKYHIIFPSTRHDLTIEKETWNKTKETYNGLKWKC